MTMPCACTEYQVSYELHLQLLLLSSIEHHLKTNQVFKVLFTNLIALMGVNTMPESRKRKLARELAEEAETIKPGSNLKTTEPESYEKRRRIYNDICVTLTWLNELLDAEKYDPANNKGKIPQTWQPMT